MAQNSIHTLSIKSLQPLISYLWSETGFRHWGWKFYSQLTSTALWSEDKINFFPFLNILGTSRLFAKKTKQVCIYYNHTKPNLNRKALMASIQRGGLRGLKYVLEILIVTCSLGLKLCPISATRGKKSVTDAIFSTQRWNISFSCEILLCCLWQQLQSTFVSSDKWAFDQREWKNVNQSFQKPVFYIAACTVLNILHENGEISNLQHIYFSHSHCGTLWRLADIFKLNPIQSL